MYDCKVNIFSLCYFKAKHESLENQNRFTEFSSIFVMFFLTQLATFQLKDERIVNYSIH